MIKKKMPLSYQSAWGELLKELTNFFGQGEFKTP